jgi:hypothetical protein
MKFDNKSLAIVMITLLEIAALFNQIDGQVFSFVVGVIAALVGYEIGTKRKN